MNPPEGVYRKRLCRDCVDYLESCGNLTNPEYSSEARALCEICHKEKATKMYRYTLTARERWRRGLDKEKPKGI